MKKREKKKSSPVKTFIDKRDALTGFNIYGLKKTKDKNVMIAVTFTTARNTNDAVRFGKIAFKYGAERVEIQGNKTPRLYYIITKKGRKFILKDNKKQNIKPKFHGSNTQTKHV